MASVFYRVSFKIGTRLVIQRENCLFCPYFLGHSEDEMQEHKNYSWNKINPIKKSLKTWKLQHGQFVTLVEPNDIKTKLNQKWIPINRWKTNDRNKCPI